MSQKYYTPSQVADMFQVNRRTVYRWISNGTLPAIKVGGVLRIPEHALEYLEKPDAQERRQLLGTAAISRRKFDRREFLITSGAAAIGSVVALIAGDFLKATGVSDAIDGPFKNLADGKDAKKIFEQIFGSVRPIHSFSVGEPIYAGKYHRDNVAAGKALLRPLGILDDSKQLPAPPDRKIGIDPKGDLVVIGGPISTLLTSIAWEFSGPTDRELRRPEIPIVPLRWYAIPNAADPEIRQDARIGWKMEETGDVATVNWHFLDTTKTPPRICPQPNWKRRITVRGQEAYLPLDNYLLITRMPNFLSPDFGESLRYNPTQWPNLLVFQGNHGVGTRAAELLVSSAGKAALEEAKSKLGKDTEFFQILLRVWELELANSYSFHNHSFHKFHEIELVDVESLDFFDTTGSKIYQRAHEYANDVIRSMSPE